MYICFSCTIITLFDNEAKPKRVQCYFETALVRFLNGEESFPLNQRSLASTSPELKESPVPRLAKCYVLTAAERERQREKEPPMLSA